MPAKLEPLRSTADHRFFFKRKTAYEIYRCDWSSDVCSSDLEVEDRAHAERLAHRHDVRHRGMVPRGEHEAEADLVDALADLRRVELAVPTHGFRQVDRAAHA